MTVAELSDNVAPYTPVLQHVVSDMELFGAHTCAAQLRCLHQLRLLVSSQLQ